MYKVLDVPEGTINLGVLGESRVGDLHLEVVDSVDNYVALVKEIYDFEALKAFVASHPNFRFLFDGMSGGMGPR